jgi:hemolysin activation/secretion protein
MQNRVGRGQVVLLNPKQGRLMGIALKSACTALVVLAAAPDTFAQSSAATEPISLKPSFFLAQVDPAKTAPLAPAGIAPVAPVASPKFEIRRYLLEGNTLLAQEQIDRVLAPFIGPNRDFGDVQRALESLQGAYQAIGYGGVEIRLPEQELERGEVKFIVIEVKIGRIAIEGNQHFSIANIRRSVPSLREGVTPNSREIAESVRLANENPSKQTAVLLRGAEREDQVDATIRVADIDPQRWSVSLDNTGNQNTGRARVGIAYQHSNLFDRDHVMTAQFITSPTQIKDVNVFGIGYRIPLYARGDSVEFVAGYSNVDSGTVQDLFLVSGQGSIFGARYNQALPKWRDLEHKLTYGLDYRAYQNQVAPEGMPDSLVPDVTVHPISLTYSADWRATGQDLSFYLNMTQNIPGGNDGQDEDFKELGARFGVGTAGYRLYRGGFNYVRAVKGDWQFRANLSAQYTDDALVAAEQFGIGGADSVRGFNERYASNDKGHRATLEAYTPDVAKRVGFGDGRVRFLAFYDTGALRRNYTQPNEQEAVNLDSGGFGVRLSHKNYLTARLDVAHVFHDGSGYSEPDNRRNINKLHFSMAWVW